MRILVTMGLFDEVSNNTYTATPLASTWATGSPLREAVIHMYVYDHVIDSSSTSRALNTSADRLFSASQLHPVTALPEYFEEKGYRNPTDAEDSPWQYTYQSKQSFYDWLSQRPKVQAAFNTTMAIARHGRGEEWFEYYPVAEKLSRQTADPEAILLVDIGGNVGHDIINFHDHFPKIPGRLVFVDQPSVISSAKDLPKGIEGIAHDIFHPYPPSLRNTKAYYLRNVLHDFPDAQALQILSHIHSSMGKDSVLLIDENALPDADVSFYAASLDLIMMSVFASLERTVGQFEELLGAAGFEVVGMWRSKEYGPGSGTLFEAVLKG
jgi:hypothetical protein